MTHATFHAHEARWFWVLAALGALVALAGLGAAHYMEEHGHIVTGMNNQIVWGLPHVFAIFLIVAASGVLNVASIGSVFGKRGLQGARAAVRPAVPRAARGRPRRADARPRPARTDDRRRDALQLHVGLRLERVPLLGHVRDRRRVPVDADGAADGRLFRLRAGLPRSSGGSCSPPAPARSSPFSSPARPTAPRCCRRCSSRCRSPGASRSS